MNKKSKTIKRLSKQIKKLNKRINKLGKRVEGLQDVSEDPMAEELQPESGLEIADQPAPSFSAEEVEVARELTDEAEAVLDILEKEEETGSSGKKMKKKGNKKSKK